MNLDFKKVLKKAEEYKGDITRFLRDMIAIPSESCDERRVVERIKEEMQKVGFDKIDIDNMGNIIGTIGHGKHIIAMDAHVDTVGIGDKGLWQYDPYKGYEDMEVIIGRGGSDQKGGMASMVYAGKIIKDLNLQGDYTLLITGTLQKHECEGNCWQYMINEDKIQPEFVVITEPTSCNIYRGQRGRMEVKVITHGSTTERGENDIYKMAPFFNELKDLNERLHYDDFLGKGTLTVSEVFFTSSSRSAMGDSQTISIDRRLTNGETYDEALEQIRNLSSVKDLKAEVSMYDYEKPSYKGVVYPTAAYFESWITDEDHPVCETLVSGYKGLFNEEPLVDKWAFSTNGVSIMGRYGIPCIGFGPGHEEESHSPNERTWKRELVNAAAMYAVIPSLYVSRLVKDSVNLGVDNYSYKE
ncbi:YgeY family selenium metabolism-linked hydrolase [Clostridium sp. CF011]|uniref:YgeY family selenium metabolism-linked hydrolase n=1 Tax=unclassified Clostridium TaxID=2614128 RepID=UPI001C0D4DC1|nr:MULTISPECIES: YgeY family selenium metabolism-linked hydrolase [unclassified Clostridium]MBU3093150.1 YgeY family selenium metabolism-linked hydrolase [Clostridium sp. CF011]MBW9147086.1 YgeY family selenium metabolism-linked hydrolase [Clostridium sp. CM027]UVE39566.1 YgeY family selenium metabolism-linked hydrolase [Clostridium sp. CM027]WAG68471.1 YgeY family selenium metabolism-linked hydrolase [Clostridium sp. CF011]